MLTKSLKVLVFIYLLSSVTVLPAFHRTTPKSSGRTAFNVFAKASAAVKIVGAASARFIQNHKKLLCLASIAALSGCVIKNRNTVRQTLTQLPSTLAHLPFAISAATSTAIRQTFRLAATTFTQLPRAVAQLPRIISALQTRLYMNLPAQRYILAGLSRRARELNCTEIFAAAHDGIIRGLELLAPLENINQTNAQGQTLLSVAASNGQAAVVRWLLDHHATPLIADNARQLPIDRAEASGFDGITQILADHALRHNGIDPNAERNTELAAAREIVDCDEAEHAYKAATQCPICLENRRDSIILTCGHTYCRACLNVQLRQAILAHSTQNLECPGCLIARGNRHRKLEMQEIVRFASRQQAHAAESIITQEFWPTIGYKLCPTAGCPCTFEVNAPQVEPRRCELCTRQYCMQCLLHHDTRITCDQARVEHAMPTGDRAYIQWLRDNTKLCPRCRRNIEKNAGCNHMTCRHSNCGYQFCWVCMGDWNNGAGPCQCYQCGRMPAAPQAH